MIKAILFDMDGVLVDFAKGFKDKAFDLTGIPMDDVNGDPVGDWLDEHAVSTDFFLNLPPMPAFHKTRDLMKNLAFNYEVRILSSCGNYNPYNVQNQKRQWLRKHGLGQVQFNWCESSYQKSFFADPHTLLVDDRYESCGPFERAGGEYIMFKTHDDLLKDLESFGIDTE